LACRSVIQHLGNTLPPSSFYDFTKSFVMGHQWIFASASLFLCMSHPALGLNLPLRGNLLPFRLDEEQREARTPHQIMACNGSVLRTEHMTFADYDSITQAIHDDLAALPTTCNVTYCPQADITGCVLRVTGHDFMDYNPELDKGGADGCLNMDDANNKGLLACLAGDNNFTLHKHYNRICTKVSLADFFVIAGEAVMNFTRGTYLQKFPEKSPVDFRSRFSYGRRTVAQCSEAAIRLPDAEQGCSEVERVFIQNLGLRWRNAAALMGAHTLGRARIAQSGYDGWWSDPENSRMFNSNFFVSLLANGWMPKRSVDGNQAKNQWINSNSNFDMWTDGKQMMLNTDICLAYSAGDMEYVDMKAQTFNCCAWSMPSTLGDAIYELNDGKFCGVTDSWTVQTWNSLPQTHTVRERMLSWNKWSEEHNRDAHSMFREMRSACCQNASEYMWNESHKRDCGAVSFNTGRAAGWVERFVQDEDVWLENFYAAWRTVMHLGSKGKLVFLHD